MTTSSTIGGSVLENSPDKDFTEEVATSSTIGASVLESNSDKNFTEEVATSSTIGASVLENNSDKNFTEEVATSSTIGVSALENSPDKDFTEDQRFSRVIRMIMEYENVVVCCNDKRDKHSFYSLILIKLRKSAFHDHRKLVILVPNSECIEDHINEIKEYMHFKVRGCVKNFINVENIKTAQVLILTGQMLCKLLSQNYLTLKNIKFLLYYDYHCILSCNCFRYHDYGGYKEVNAILEKEPNNIQKVGICNSLFSLACPHRKKNCLKNDDVQQLRKIKDLLEGILFKDRLMIISKIEANILHSDKLDEMMIEEDGATMQLSKILNASRQRNVIVCCDDKNELDFMVHLMIQNRCMMDKTIIFVVPNESDIEQKVQQITFSTECKIKVCAENTIPDKSFLQNNVHDILILSGKTMCTLLKNDDLPLRKYILCILFFYDCRSLLNCCYPNKDYKEIIGFLDKNYIDVNICGLTTSLSSFVCPHNVQRNAAALKQGDNFIRQLRDVTQKMETLFKGTLMTFKPENALWKILNPP